MKKRLISVNKLEVLKQCQRKVAMKIFYTEIDGITMTFSDLIKT